MVQGIKSSKGVVGIETFQGRLRLRLPRSLYEGKQKYITLGLADTEENRAIAEPYRAQCELDIKINQFDWTHRKYKPGSHLTVVEELKPKEVQFHDLWKRFSAYKAPRLATTTKSKYQSVDALLTRYGKNICTDEDVRSYINFERSQGNKERTIKDRLSLLKSCGEWGVRKKLISENPFYESLELVKPERLDKPDPFNKSEVQAIIEAFKSDRYYSHYTDYVKFLFFTGCRPSEAIGLQWKHIKTDFSNIHFQASLTRGERKDIKTGEDRDFPCKGTITEFLKSIKPENCNPNDLVFPSPKRTSIDDHNFSQRAWKKVLENAGIRHRVPYNTRHTFISHCIAKRMDLMQIATLAGNSPEVILERYAGQGKRILISTDKQVQNRCQIEASRQQES